MVLFRLFEREDRAISLPPIARSKRLPVVLNRSEVLQLLNAPKLLKHRVLLGLTYAAGLRLFEVQSLKIADIDFVRQTVFVRRGKNGKSRYIPIGTDILRGIESYISSVNPRQYLFEGQSKGKAIESESFTQQSNGGTIHLYFNSFNQNQVWNLVEII